MTPTELRAMATIDDADKRYDLNDLKVILTAGEPCTPGVINSFNETFGLSVREGYGQTETCVIACNLPGMEIKPGPMGRFTPGVEGAIVNPETGERVPEGEKGMIAVVKVFVVLQEGHEPSEQLIKDIQQHVKRITAPYKYPREIEFVKEGVSQLVLTPKIFLLF